MSYYMSSYRPVNPGTPMSFWSPIPGWQTNPLASGPYRVAMDGCTSGCGAVQVTDADYLQTGWGTVYAAAAASLLVGVAAGYAAGKTAEKRRYRRNAARRRRRTF